jgi:hypothetical protein
MGHVNVNKMNLVTCQKTKRKTFFEKKTKKTDIFFQSRKPKPIPIPTDVKNEIPQGSNGHWEFVRICVRITKPL